MWSNAEATTMQSEANYCRFCECDVNVVWQIQDVCANISSSSGRGQAGDQEARGSSKQGEETSRSSQVLGHGQGGARRSQGAFCRLCSSWPPTLWYSNDFTIHKRDSNVETMFDVQNSIDFGVFWQEKLTWIRQIFKKYYFCFQCFDAVDWAAGRASGL